MKKYAAIVFKTQPEDIDIVIEQFRKNSEVDIIFFKTSFDKLWVVQEPTPKEENHDKN